MDDRKKFLKGNQNIPNWNSVDACSPVEYQHRAREIIRCKDDIVYFAENYFYIVHPDLGKHIIKLYPKQKELLLLFTNKKRVVCTASRQSGKTTTYTIFSLWKTMFSTNTKILISANKKESSIEFLDRIKLAYEMLPNWIKPRIKTYNKSLIEFTDQNGSKIEACSTSPDSGRGKTCSILIIDECVIGSTEISIRKKSKAGYKNVTIESIFNNPKAVSTHKNAAFNVKSIDDMEVLTPSGWSSFSGVKQLINANCRAGIKLTTESGKSLICTEDHILFSNDKDTILARDVEVGEYILTDDDLERISNIEKVQIDEPVYDLLNVEYSSRYFTNGICSHNCAFIPQHIMKEYWASTYPVISSGKTTQVIMVSTPNGLGNIFADTYFAAKDGKSKEGWRPFRIDWWDVPGRDQEWKEITIESLNGTNKNETFMQEFENSFLAAKSPTLVKMDTISRLRERGLNKIYFKPGELIIKGQVDEYKVDQWFIPEKDRTYVLGCDVADGVGGNASVCYVLDITDYSRPTCVALFSSNTISTRNFAYVLFVLGTAYNKGYIAIEANGLGRAVLDVLGIYGYENIIKIGKHKHSGIYSHVQLKIKACLWLKDVLESPNVSLNVMDQKFYDELTWFTKKNNHSRHAVYQAITGKDDDHVMALIWGMYVAKEEIAGKYYIIHSTFNIGENVLASKYIQQDEYVSIDPNRDIFDGKIDLNRIDGKRELDYSIQTNELLKPEEIDEYEGFQTSTDFISSDNNEISSDLPYKRINLSDAVIDEVYVDKHEELLNRFLPDRRDPQINLDEDRENMLDKMFADESLSLGGITNSYISYGNNGFN